MKKADLLTVVQSKVGFNSILSDKIASDSTHPTKQKRYLIVETANSDGTKGMYNVFYIHDTETDEASFYNQLPPESFDMTYKDANQTVIDALVDYCKTNFDAFFILKVDGTNLWAEVETFTLVSGKLEKKNVLVFKKGTTPISHLVII